MRITCPNKSGVLYKELLKLNNNDEDLTTYAHDIITELQDLGLISLTRYKKLNGEFVYTIPKIMTARSIAKNLIGSSAYQIDLGAKKRLDNYVKANNISFIDTKITNNGNAIFVNITPVKNNRLDFFLGDEALYEQELNEDRELKINRIQEEIKNKFETNKLFSQDLAKKIQDKLQKLYPEIKLNITNSPVWEQGDNIFNQNIEEKLNNFELFEDQDKLCPNGICNFTAKSSTDYLEKIGLNPYPSNYNGSQLPVKVKSPIGNFDIEHYVSAVVINNNVFIYDMPQHEFISNEFFGQGSDVKVKESFKPRLISLTLDEIKANYNLTTKEAGNFIYSILNRKGWFENGEMQLSFKEYIQKNVKNPEEYINLLESQIKDSGYEFKQWDVEEYKKDIKNKRDNLKTKKVTKEEEQNVIKYYKNKLKLKTKEYLPKKVDKFSLKTLVDSIIGRGFDSHIDFSSFENALQSLDNYLKSENFIEDLLTKTQNAEESLNSINKSIEQVYSLSRLFASFTKQVKIYGIEEALKKYDDKEQYTIRTLLPSNVLDKYKSKEQAALLLQKYWGNKDNIVKQLNIFKSKTFTDLITNKFKTYSTFNKYQTVLNFLKSTDFDSSYIYQVISNEAIRKYSYFDKIGNTQFQKDELNRIIGQANIKAMTVLIDAINQKQDTLPHEYAHHYIAWFRNTPIVQEAIKKWGSEEALVQSIGEQVVKQKGEAYNWWNKFVKWVMNLFSDLSTKNKQELTNILTDAFLQRVDLETYQKGFNIDRINQLLSKTSPGTYNQQQSIKPGVDELFSSNPELANQVYEALEYSYTGEYSPSFLYESGIKASDGLGYVTYKVRVNNKGDKYLTSLDKTPNAVEKNMGVRAYYKFIIENKDKNITTDNELSVAGKKVLEQLEKKGYVTKTDAKIIETKKSGAGYELDVYDKPLYEFTDKIPESYLTPQQEQQAKQLYSQYLDTIFPDSKVKDIVYRGGDIGEIDIPFTTLYSYAKEYADERGVDVITAILNVKGKLLKEEIKKPDLRSDGYNGYVYEDYKKVEHPKNEKVFGTYYIVNKPEQIHILGGKQDIEGFKEFVGKTPTQTTDNFNQEDTQIINNLINEGEIKTKCD
jgi:hypothetical protein